MTLGDVMQVLVPAGLTALFGWIWNIDRRVAVHDTVIAKMDKLVDLLLQRELDNK